MITAIDTHWIWQDGQHLTRNPFLIRDGMLTVPDRAGLGIDLDLDEIERAHALYKSEGLGARNDAAQMQFLFRIGSSIPNVQAWCADEQSR